MFSSNPSNSGNYTEVSTDPKSCESPSLHSHDDTLYSYTEPPQQRKQESWRKWCGENILKVVQVIVLIDIAILLTIDVTATLVARVAHSKKCSTYRESVPSHDGVSVIIGSNGHQSDISGVLDYKTEFVMREEWGEYHQEPWDLPPSDELDAAWDDLLVARDIRLSPGELERLNGNTTNRVELTDGDYVAVLGPYHLLHCMNIMRRVIHWDYYGPRMTEKERGSFIYTHKHSDHCLELFRQHVMCHGYPTLYTGEWVADSKTFPNKELRAGGLTKCVNWDTMDGWARQRALNVKEHKVKPGPFEKHSGRNRNQKTT